MTSCHRLLFVDIVNLTPLSGMRSCFRTFAAAKITTLCCQTQQREQRNVPGLTFPAPFGPAREPVLSFPPPALARSSLLPALVFSRVSSLSTLVPMCFVVRPSRSSCWLLYSLSVISTGKEGRSSNNC